MVPEEDGHQDAVNQYRGGPESPALEQSPGRSFHRQEEAALGDAQCKKGQAGRQTVADLFAAHRYHADGIGSEDDQRDEGGQSAAGPEKSAAGSADAAALPGKTELVDREPDENVVEPAEEPPAGAEASEQVNEPHAGPCIDSSSFVI